MDVDIIATDELYKKARVTRRCEHCACKITQKVPSPQQEWSTFCPCQVDHRRVGSAAVKHRDRNITHNKTRLLRLRLIRKDIHTTQYKN